MSKVQCQSPITDYTDDRSLTFVFNLRNRPNLRIVLPMFQHHGLNRPRYSPEMMKPLTISAR
ncbi:hypothetical protein BH18ACI4_BH18ACI4_18360 [soil metagenome]